MTVVPVASRWRASGSWVGRNTVLNHLIAEGQVTRAHRDTDRAGSRPRYQITPAGEHALEAWLATPVEMEGTRNELALKLYFGHLTSAAVSRAHLEVHRA